MLYLVSHGPTTPHIGKKADELTNFIVTVGEGEPIEAVVLRLEAMGIDVERVMKRTRVLGGRGSFRLLQEISTVPGVKHARVELGVQLPPFHESVPRQHQWHRFEVVI